MFENFISSLSKVVWLQIRTEDHKQLCLYMLASPSRTPQPTRYHQELSLVSMVYSSLASVWEFYQLVVQSLMTSDTNRGPQTVVSLYARQSISQLASHMYYDFGAAEINISAWTKSISFEWKHIPRCNMFSHPPKFIFIHCEK